MKNKYDICLLVDANKVSNFFNKITLQNSDYVNKVIVAENCFDATKFISPKKSLHPIPDIIFLDLNTPFMSGWEFLEKYNQLNDNQKKYVVIYNTDSLHHEEIAKLNEYSFIKSFTKKDIDRNFLTEFSQSLRQRETISEKVNF